MWTEMPSSTMEIVGLEAIPIEANVSPLDEGGIAPYVTNNGTLDTAQRMIIRLETDAGTVGWGESMIEMDPIAMKTLIEREIAPKVIGRPIWEIEAIWEEFFYYYVDIEALIGPIEMAMWDALGKNLGAPLYQLLGGKCRDEVDVTYCVGILGPEESREHAKRAVDEGFSVLKTKGGHDWQTDVNRLIAMDDEVDGELEFRIDPNQGWTFEEAVRVGARLEDAGVYVQYLEQPCRIETYGTYKRLRERLRQPIGANDDTYFSHNLYQLVKNDAIDVGIVDLVPTGITGIQRTAGVAADAGISLAHHCGFDLAVKSAAMLHVVASSPAFNLPSDTTYYAWDDYIAEEPLTVTDGTIQVPDGPGLGVDVNESKIESMRID